MAQIVTTLFLENVAKLINGEEALMPEYVVVGDTPMTIFTPTQANLDDEYDARLEADVVRVGREVTYSAMRLGATVTDGEDALPTSGLALSGTAQAPDLMAALTHNGITQTDNFDIEFVYTIKVAR